MAALVVGGMAFTSSASATSVGITDFRMYNSTTRIDPATAPAGSLRGFWIQVKFTSALAVGQKVSIMGPTGASFSSNLNDYTMNLNGYAGPPTAAAPLNGGQGVELTVPVAITANDSRYITFGGGFPNVTKTGVGTQSGPRSMSVSTTTDTTPTATPTYEITPGPVDHIGIPGGGAVSATVGTNF
ncbi:MAG: hypothetical protein WBW62_00165, partial [Solirubrobacterales bacterium]